MDEKMNNMQATKQQKWTVGGIASLACLAWPDRTPSKPFNNSHCTQAVQSSRGTRAPGSKQEIEFRTVVPRGTGTI